MRIQPGKNLFSSMPTSGIRCFVPIVLVLAFAWSMTAVAFYAARAEPNFSPDGLRFWFVLFPVTFAGVFLAGRRVFQQISAINLRALAALVLISICLAGLVNAHRLAPLPALPLNHVLTIEITEAEPGQQAPGGVEITKARTLDGKRLALDRFNLSGDWELTESGGLTSGGAPGSKITYAGPLAGGIALTLRHNPQSGKVKVTWDGKAQTIDLYAEYDYTFNQVFFGSIWGNGSPWPILITTSVLAAYFLTLSSLFFILGALIWLSAGRNRLPAAVYIAAGILVFYFFVRVKFTYAELDQGRIFRDTYSYVKTAGHPLASLQFWAGERPFTLPLFFKILGVNTLNYTDAAAKDLVRSAQTWFSIFCWTVLAAASSTLLIQKWMKPLCFGLVLFFSASAEISLWDGHLLTESLSFSLFALMTASWFFLLRLESGRMSRWAGWLIFGTALLSTLLFAFVREANIYIALLGPTALAASRYKRIRIARPSPGTAYLGFTILLAALQVLTMRGGERWQVHLVDTLTERLLLDTDSASYFTQAGLPVQATRTKLIGLLGPDYILQPGSGSADQAIIDWIDAKGMRAYTSYLLANPGKTLLEPIRQARALLNGSNLEYRALKFGEVPPDDLVARLTALYYTHNPVLLWTGAFLVMVGFYRYGLKERPRRREWWILAAFILSLYPLMLLVWHANPKEIERHAAQLGIQLRLAAGLAAVMWLDRLLSAPALAARLKTPGGRQK